MKSRVEPEAYVNRMKVNRRRFLQGAGSVAIGLPFLEGLPERSAWAADAVPVFSLFVVASCGVVGKKFFPASTGAFTTASLAGMTDKATSVLSPHAANLLFLKGINYPVTGPRSCGHAEGLCQTLTAVAPGGSGNTSYSGGMSADMAIAKIVNPNATDPLTLYAGSKNYIAERISFKGAGAGQVRSADLNPYLLYSKVVGLTTSTPGGTTTTDPVAAELIATRKSVNDLVRSELNSLMNTSALSANDKQRLKQHFDSIRDAEVTMGGMAGAACSTDGLAKDKFEALKSGVAFNTNGMIEDVVKLHLEITALAFACNYNRVATLQWGDGTDGTKYSVPSNSGLGWTFHQLSHRIQSDAQVGSNPTAENAHAEVDVLRMQTLLYGLNAFKARGLFDKSILMWTTHISDGPSHSMSNMPIIIAGNGGGLLRQGTFVDGGSAANSKLLNTLMAAAVKDKTTSAPTLGGTALLPGIMA